MIWEEIMCSKIVKKQDLINMFCEVFKISEQNVCVASNIDELVLDDKIKVLCQTYLANTSFPLRLVIYIRDKSIVLKSELEVLENMCEALECEIMICGYFDNDSRGLKIAAVDIDLEKYELAEEYELE